MDVGEIAGMTVLAVLMLAIIFGSYTEFKFFCCNCGNRLKSIKYFTRYSATTGMRKIKKEVYCPACEARYKESARLHREEEEAFEKMVAECIKEEWFGNGTQG